MNITNLINKIKRMRKKLNDKLINNYTDKRLKPQDRILMSDRTYKNIEYNVFVVFFELIHL